LAILVAVLGALIAVPRRVDPSELPLPVVDSGVLRQILAADRVLAKQLAPELAREIANPTGGGGLFDLRAFGEKYRAYGAAEATVDPANAVLARQQLVQAIPPARALGDDRLLALRAYQQELFLAEVAKWDATRVESTELVELAGPFVRLVSRHGWSDDRGRLAMNEPLRAVFFKRRWAEITGLLTAPFALGTEETRAFYAFLLSHPWVDRELTLDPKAACLLADRWRLRKIDELARRDPSYPRLLGRGVLFFRLGDYTSAAQAFRDYLQSASDPPYVLRARNYLVAANARAEEAPPAEAP